jgi:hypothetical protein
MMVRITLTEPKTTLAGVMLETSLARFMTSIAAFNDERATSRRRWGFASMVETCGCCEKAARCAAVRKSPSHNGGGRPSCQDMPRVNRTIRRKSHLLSMRFRLYSLRSNDLRHHQHSPVLSLCLSLSLPRRNTHLVNRCPDAPAHASLQNSAPSAPPELRKPEKAGN